MIIWTRERADKTWLDQFKCTLYEAGDIYKFHFPFLKARAQASFDVRRNDIRSPQYLRQIHLADHILYFDLLGNELAQSHYTGPTIRLSKAMLANKVKLPLPPIASIYIDKEERAKRVHYYTITGELMVGLIEPFYLQVTEDIQSTYQRLNVKVPILRERRENPDAPLRKDWVNHDSDYIERDYVNMNLKYFEQDLIEYCNRIFDAVETIPHKLVRGVSLSNYHWIPFLDTQIIHDYTQRELGPSASSDSEPNDIFAIDSRGELERFRLEGAKELDEHKSIHIMFEADLNINFSIRVDATDPDIINIGTDQDDQLPNILLPREDIPHFIDWFVTHIHAFTDYLSAFDIVRGTSDPSEDVIPPRPSIMWFLHQYRARTIGTDKKLWPTGAGPVPTCDDIEEAIKLVSGREDEFLRLVYKQIFQWNCVNESGIMRGKIIK